MRPPASIPNSSAMNKRYLMKGVETCDESVR